MRFCLPRAEVVSIERTLWTITGFDSGTSVRRSS